jgi:hypothetical protein
MSDCHEMRLIIFFPVVKVEKITRNFVVQGLVRAVGSYLVDQDIRPGYET